MRKFRSLTALLLALALLLAGCGGKGSIGGNEPDSGKDTPTENLLDIGRIDGNTYTNAYTGYGCTVGDGWVFSSAEELQEMPANVRDTLKGTDMGELLENVSQFTDMMVQDTSTGNNVNVLYQKLDLQTRLAYAAMSMDDVLDATLKEKDTMIASYEAMGMANVTIDKITVTFLGQECPALYTTASIDGVPLYMTQLFQHQLGEYMVTLTATSVMENATDDLLALFFAVD